MRRAEAAAAAFCSNRCEAPSLAPPTPRHPLPAGTPAASRNRGRSNGGFATRRPGARPRRKRAPRPRRGESSNRPACRRYRTALRRSSEPEPVARSGLLADGEGDGAALVELGIEHLVFEYHSGVLFQEHPRARAFYDLIGRLGGRSEVYRQACIILGRADAKAGVLGDSRLLGKVLDQRAGVFGQSKHEWFLPVSGECSTFPASPPSLNLEARILMKLTRSAIRCENPARFDWSMTVTEQSWHVARLIPTSGINGADEQERRATSALLSVMSSVKEFGRALTGPLGAPAGRLETFIEVPFVLGDKKIFPDGLIRASWEIGRASW